MYGLIIQPLSQFNLFTSLLISRPLLFYHLQVKNFKIRDINITTENPEFIIEKELQNNQSQQWVSFDTVSSKIRIEVISAYPGEELNGQKAFKECAIQEISFLGR